MADTNNQGPATPSQDAPASLEVTAQSVPNTDEAFARREKQMRRMQQELQMQRQQLDAKMKQYETDYVPKSRLKEDFLGVLEEQGISYDTLAEQALAQPNDPATRALMQKIRALEEKQTRSERMAQEQDQQRYDAAKKQVANEVRMLVDADPEFETVKSADMYDAVVELIEHTFKEEGYVMDTKTAARRVEEELLEDYLKMASLSKIQAKLKLKTEQLPVDTAAAPETKPKLDRNSITITNRMSAEEPKRGTSDADRRAKAIAAFMGKN